MQRGMAIRKAEIHDVPALVVMNKRLVEDERYPNPMTVEELTERMHGWLSTGEYTSYLGLLFESPVAYCLFRDEKQHCYMRQLYVEREYRRQQLGSQLLDWMFEHIWMRQPVRLDVLAHNKRAIQFYESYGFVTSCLSMEKRP